MGRTRSGLGGPATPHLEDMLLGQPGVCFSISEDARASQLTVKSHDVGEDTWTVQAQSSQDHPRSLVLLS